jgi:hypothetical protein
MQFDSHLFVRIGKDFGIYHLVIPDEQATRCGLDVTEQDHAHFYRPNIVRATMASFYKNTRPCRQCEGIQIKNYYDN